MQGIKKKFLSRPIPLWIFLVGVFALLGVFALFLYFLGSQAYSYTVKIPQGNGVDLSEFSWGAHPKLENAEFFSKVRDEFIAQKASFVEADLSAMKLRLYENGQTRHEVPILTKGKEGSWWETPAGLYKAQAKTGNHFSSFGNVYMPFSVPFQGNFFIHGWPYHPDGTPVESTFSGGCIRLATEDAEKIYELVKVGMPILVHEDDFATDDFTYKGNLAGIAADQVLVADLKSNFVLLQRESKQLVPIASITKLVTAIVATEYINIEKEIAIPQNVLVQTTKPRLEVGQRVSVYSLLYPLLEESSNEAAEAFTHFLGPTYFNNLMNEKAQSLGMQNTHLADASGLSAENVSTAEDLFNLAKYMYHNRSFLLGVSAGRIERPDLYGYPAFQNLQNYNLFADYSGFVGGKIGKTNAAKETYMAIFEFQVQGETRPIAVILLGSDDVTLDTQRVLNYLRESYADTTAI